MEHSKPKAKSSFAQGPILCQPAIRRWIWTRPSREHLGVFCVQRCVPEEFQPGTATFCAEGPLLTLTRDTEALKPSSDRPGNEAKPTRDKMCRVVPSTADFLVRDQCFIWLCR
jgi:hypothetical protein